MPLIGRQLNAYSDRVVLDSLTASATADYTLQLNGSNFVPSSAESLTVSLNGVIQKPQDSYTVSSSTLSFNSALTASDSIDFVIAERGITLQTPSAGSVNTEQLANGSVSLAKLSATGTKDATTFLRGDNTFAEAGGGLLLQIVSFSSSGSTNTTSNSYVDTALSATITPSSASNKVLIIHSGACEPSSGTAVELTAERNGTLVANKLFTSQVQGLSNNAHFTFLDSPASTSALLYKIKLRSSVNGVNSNHNSQNPTASIILMEISA